MPKLIEKVGFHYKACRKNPDYEAGIRKLPLRSCLIDDNSDSFKQVKTAPKWFTELKYYNVAVSGDNAGEILSDEIYVSDDFKQSNGGKIKALDAFCNRYQPLYHQRKVSLLFLTFTRANQARVTFRQMLDNARKRFKAQDVSVRGFIWTAEVSEKLHWHYHVCFAVDRVSWSKIPQWMKFNNLWGQRTGIEFVRKNVKHYMAKYFAKHQYRVIGQRSYGRSRKFQ